MFFRHLIVLALLSTRLPAVELRVATFNIGAHFTTSSSGVYYPDYGLGAPGTPDHEAVRLVLQRINAEVVALQEIHSADVNAGDLAALAAGLGYPHVFVTPSTNTFDNSLRVAVLSRFPFLSQTAIASPAGAREMNRLIPAVRVDVPGTNRDPLLVAAHLKSGGEASDLFQRAIELRRLRGHLSGLGLTAADNFILMGDFNLSGNPREFTSQPATGLPDNFVLGPDIAFPVAYATDPAAYFFQPAAVRIVPRQPDGSQVTFPSSGSTLDVFLGSGIVATRPLHTEIYNSALDSANAPGLPKAGDPPPASTSAIASDHLALFGDFELDPAVPYTFTAAGQTVTETFAAFTGAYEPYPWTTVGGNWLGIDAGSGTTAGFRAYGPPADPSLGFLPNAAPGTATAAFVNGSSAVLSALRISFTAEQWRSAFGGTADTLGVELIVNDVATPLPALAFQAATNRPSGAIANGTSTVREATVTGLAIAPGTPFQLRFTFTPGTGASAPPSAVFINELNYDDNGTDDEEFVEIVAGPGFTGSLANVMLLLYNGSNGQTYGSSHALSTFTAGAVTATGHRIYHKAISGLQNDIDGMALVVNGAVTQFISYEGAFAATNGAAAGMTSTDIGVSQTGGDPSGTSSLGLIGSGGAPAVFSWAKFTGQAFSQGQPNPGQTFTNNVLPPQGLAIDNLAVTFISSGDSDGDGMADLDEILFGSDPHSAASRYTVSLTRTSASTLTLSFHRIAASSYVLESSTDLSRWETWKTYPAGVDADTDVSVTITPGTPARFYRLRAKAP